MWKRRSCSLVLHIGQVFIFCAAFYVAMTRITDNKHHVTDVFAGAGIGVLMGVLTSYYSMQFYKRCEVEIRKKSRLYKRSTSEFANEDSHDVEETEQFGIDKIV